MQLHELNLTQLLEVKLLRLNKPKFNSTYLPLNGSYNSLPDLETLENPLTIANTSSHLPLENKFKNFQIQHPSSVSVDNMLQLTSKFGKVLFGESLEALIVFVNTSDREIKIRDLKIKVSNEPMENAESYFKKIEYPLVNMTTNQTQQMITIPGNKNYTHKIKLSADIVCKYAIEIEFFYLSSYYNEELAKQSVNKIIKTISSQYVIESTNNSVVMKKFYKKFLFDTNLPFKIKEKFTNDSMERCYLEVDLVNQSPYALHICDVLLISESEKSSGIDIVLLREKQFKNFIIESDEEVNLVFVSSNYKQFMSNASYVLKLSWNNVFDSVGKYISFIIKNKMNTFNEMFAIHVIEKPKVNVILNESFKVIFQLTNKTSKPYRFKISTEKLHDKDLEVIDIVEKEVELVDKVNFCILCRSEVKGNVFLPRLSLTEEMTKKPTSYDKLLNFNCIEEVNLI